MLQFVYMQSSVLDFTEQRMDSVNSTTNQTSLNPPSCRPIERIMWVLMIRARSCICNCIYLFRNSTRLLSEGVGGLHIILWSSAVCSRSQSWFSQEKLLFKGLCHSYVTYQVTSGDLDVTRYSTSCDKSFCHRNFWNHVWLLPYYFFNWIYPSIHPSIFCNVILFMYFF